MVGGGSGGSEECRSGEKGVRVGVGWGRGGWREMKCRLGLSLGINNIDCIGIDRTIVQYVCAYVWERDNERDRQREIEIERQ